MATIKEDALELAELCQAAEAAGSTPALDNLHDALRRCLYRHRKVLGLTNDDVAEIDNHGAVTFGGTPKGPPPDDQ